MKKLSLLLLASTLLVNAPAKAFISGGATMFGHTYWSEVAMHVGCWNAGQCPYDPFHSLPACAPFCDVPDLPYAWSIWIDYATAAATLLDVASAWTQDTRVIDAGDAVKELEEYLAEDSTSSGSCSKNAESALEAEEMEVYAPQIVVDSLDNYEDLDAVRQAVEKYVFETTDPEINGECKDSEAKCAENRQNTWALLSVGLAEAMSDKIISNTEDLKSHFQSLADQYSGEKSSPKALWGGMSAITLDTHVQMNDLNALFARDLEMTALGGLNNSGTEEIKR